MPDQAAAQDIELRIITQGGDDHSIAAPPDIQVADFIEELRIALNLPLADAGGNTIAWRLDNKDTGRTLEHGRTLAENGVLASHRLSLIRQVTAGSPLPIRDIN